jgi:hypothetical protein
VPEHQLDDADVDAVREEAARAFVTQVMPVQVDLTQLGAIDAGSRLRALRLVAVSD